MEKEVGKADEMTGQKVKGGGRRLVLGSMSPRRCDFMRQMGYAFEVTSPTTVEKRREGEDATGYVLRNAREKAESVAEREGASAVVIAADTVVAMGGRVLEKPKSKAEARSMLEELSGRTHQVITGYCVMGAGADGAARQVVDAVVTDVEFKELSAQEIAAYVASGEPMDKAGAYAIQGGAAYMVRRVVGSYTNVVGLPMTELVEVLAGEFGIWPTFKQPEWS